jgi:hypothetical protein
MIGMRPETATAPSADQRIEARRAVVERRWKRSTLLGKLRPHRKGDRIRLRWQEGGGSPGDAAG